MSKKKAKKRVKPIKYLANGCIVTANLLPVYKKAMKHVRKTAEPRAIVTLNGVTTHVPEVRSATCRIITSLGGTYHGPILVMG